MLQIDELNGIIWWMKWVWLKYNGRWWNVHKINFNLNSCGWTLLKRAVHTKRVRGVQYTYIYSKWMYSQWNRWIVCCCLCLQHILDPFHFFFFVIICRYLNESARHTVSNTIAKAVYPSIHTLTKCFCHTTDVCWFRYDKKNTNASTLLTHKHSISFAFSVSHSLSFCVYVLMSVCMYVVTRTQWAAARTHKRMLRDMYISCAFSV